MISQKLNQKISSYVKAFQRYADRIWYPIFIGFLAAIDNLVIFIPNDGILISSSMLIPRRWFVMALSVAIGSTLGALALAVVVETYGLSVILNFYPSFNETNTWLLTLKFFEKYGLVLVFLIAASPIAQQPAVVLASLAKTPLFYLALVIFAGRLIKFLVMAYIGSHMPKLLKKLWGVKSELKEVGIKLD